MANHLSNSIWEAYLTFLTALISLGKYYGIILLDTSEPVSHCFTMGTGSLHSRLKIPSHEVSVIFLLYLCIYWVYMTVLF